MSKKPQDELLSTQQSVELVDVRPSIDLSAPFKSILGTDAHPREKSSKEQKRWYTEHLGQRLAVDTMSAASAGGLVAPLICMIDRAIIENASGKQPMMQSLRNSMASLLLRPHIFLTSRPFALIFALYSGTYLSANFLDTFKSTVNDKPADTVSSGYSKFAATSVTNLSLCLYKDSQFTKLFGTVSPRPIPPVTYGLFAIRDCLTIFASFNLPPIVAPMLPMTQAAEHYVSRASAAQFIAPAAIQLISTPFHLMGLDLYNRNGGTKFGDRLNKVRIDYLKSSIARMCRIVPAFGLGGVVNNGLRKRSMLAIEG